MPEPPTLHCLLCGASGAGEPVADTLRDDPSGRYTVARCLTCGHLQLSPLPPEEEDAAFYDADAQVRNLGRGVDVEASRRKAGPDTERRRRWAHAVLGERPGPVLDVGCGYGFFVDALAREGVDVTGLEVSSQRVALAAEVHQGRFLEGRVDGALEAEHGGRYALVTLFHVLEHVREPVAFLRTCAALLQPGGTLLVEVPNAGDSLLTHCEPYRRFYWQRAHVSYYDAPRLDLAFRKAGMGRFEVRGVQRYGIGNLLHWVERGEPQLADPDHGTDHPALARLEALYHDDRSRTLTSDTLVAEVGAVREG